MKLIKVKDGLIEVENFFLTSNFNDFAGNKSITRDIKTGKLKLISNNKIERKFNYDEFVIELEKENFKTMGIDDYSMFYLGNEKYTFGIRDKELNKQNKYWKILRKDGYIQAYASNDGINYENIGGMKFDEPVTKQGFMKYNDEDFILDNYKVYANPYITIQNLPQGTICELYDIDNKLLKTRKFDKNLECKVFIDSNMGGYFIFKDIDEKVIYKTGILSLQYGDIYVLSPYNFEVIYQGSIITNTKPSLLQDLDEMITIKNIGDKDYTKIKIGIQTSSDDLIQLSFNGEKYEDYLIIDSIKQGESKDIYVRIIKNANNHNFNVRDFQLIINE